jgi:hypothetical protein
VSPEYACSLERRGEDHEDDHISDEEDDEVAFDWVEKEVYTLPHDAQNTHMYEHTRMKHSSYSVAT